MKLRSTNIRRLIAFTPALILASVTVFAASGASVVPSAGAADPSADVNVSGTIASSLTISLDNCATDGGGTGQRTLSDFNKLGTGAADGSEAAVSDPCTVKFSGNSATKLSFEDSATGTPGAFFCSDTLNINGTQTGPRGCDRTPGVSDRIANVGAGHTNSLATEGFGLTLSATEASSNLISKSSTGSPSGSENIWSAITSTQQDMCEAAANADASCSFNFGANAPSSLQAGVYSGKVKLTVQQK